MHRRFFTLAVALLSVSFANSSMAVVYQVPSAATPTIASALAVAADGDRIEVAPGTYLESNLELEAAVTLIGTAGASVTTIDAHGDGSVMAVTHNDGDATVEGFTITGAVTGITISIGDIVIRDCIITGNSNEDGFGGGIFYMAYSIILVQQCVISENTAGYGGGVCGFLRGDLTLSDCVIEDNHASSGGGAVAALSTSYPIKMLDCIVRGNAAASGGGLFGDTGTIVRDCTFLNNVASQEGGAIAAFAHGGEIARSLFRGNHAGTLGGAISLGDASGISPFSIINCTIVENEAPQGGGIFTGHDSNKITRCILAYSTLGDGMTCAGSANPTLTCCDVFGNAGGDALCGVDGGGNFSLDPQFCDRAAGDFHLRTSSPCLEQNHPTAFSCGGDIGAFGAACAPTDVPDTELRSWGRVKSLYR